jgi:hypothetical protein
MKEQLLVLSRSRIHSSLGGQTPAEVSENRGRQRVNILEHRWRSHRGGHCQLPVAAQLPIRHGQEFRSELLPAVRIEKYRETPGARGQSPKLLIH